eukprot:TRINITY_DN531_c1_g1_i1.p1 TRINITY_DN531_c1_g1~~TRINITY_DN531_c1_g1_i1.p1  ORF type:complete len:983 (-),score=302.74 TRINITY_DN531_c1_g1_i1:23-2947(-)
MDVATIDTGAPVDSDSEDGEAVFPRLQLCESIRVSYQDPATKVRKSEDAFLDPRDAWSSGGNLLLVDAAAVSALQKKADKEQSFAISSMFATERCRRDYLREQQYLLGQLRRLLETTPNVPKQMAADAQVAIDKAMEIAESVNADYQVPEEDLKIATEWYVPKRDTDDELLQYLQEADIDLGDETQRRLLLKKMMNTNKESIRERDRIRAKLEAIEGTGGAERGPEDAGSKLKLLHGMIIQAQNEGASWTEIAMNVIDAAAQKWRQIKKEDEETGNTSVNILQATEDTMTDNLRERYQELLKKQQEIQPRLKGWYAMLAQQEEHSAALFTAKSKAEKVEEQAAKREAAVQAATAKIEKKRAEKEAKDKAQKEAKAQKKKLQKEEERAQLKALEREALGGSDDFDFFGGDDDSSFGGDGGESDDPIFGGSAGVGPGGKPSSRPAGPKGAVLLKMMNKEQQETLKHLESATEECVQKKKKMNQRIQELKTEVQEAQTIKKKNKERVQKAKKKIEEQQTQAVRAREKAEKAVEKREVLAKEVKQLSEKKTKMRTEVKEATVPVPQDIGPQIEHAEAEISKAQAPYQEFRAEEQQVWAKERSLEEKLAKAVAALKAKGLASADTAVVKEKAPAAARPVTQLRKKRQPEGDPMLMGYHERLKVPSYAELPRYLQLHTDNRARERQSQKRQETLHEEEAEQLMAKLHHSDGEEETSRNAMPGHSQAPVWFCRNEDIRVKLARATQATSEIEGVLSQCSEKVRELKKELRKRGKDLERNLADSAELFSEAAMSFKEGLRSSALPDSAMREQLLEALQEQQVCAQQAEDAWRLAELGCDIGCREKELEHEEMACSVREEALMGACRTLYSTASQAVMDGPEEVVSLARRFTTDWSAAETQLSSAPWKERVWPSLFRAAARHDNERATQESLTKLLEIEAKRKHLLDAELVAPPEAKRSLAAMRAAASEETRQRSARGLSLME